MKEKGTHVWGRNDYLHDLGREYVGLLDLRLNWFVDGLW